MQLSLGAIFLGVAWLTRTSPRWTGAIWLVAGLGAAALVRPHIALAALAPLAVALAVRHRTRRRWIAAPEDRCGANRRVVVLAAASIVLLNRLGTVFGSRRRSGQARSRACSTPRRASPRRAGRSSRRAR